IYLASVNSFGTIPDTPFLSPKCLQYYLRPSPPHCGDMMTFVPNGINQGALALPAKTRILLANRVWCTSFGIIDLRSTFLAWNSRPLAAAQEMPIASAVPCIEHSNYDPEGRSQTLDGF